MIHSNDHYQISTANLWTACPAAIALIQPVWALLTEHSQRLEIFLHALVLRLSSSQRPGCSWVLKDRCQGISPCCTINVFYVKSVIAASCSALLIPVVPLVLTANQICLSSSCEPYFCWSFQKDAVVFIVEEQTHIFFVALSEEQAEDMNCKWIEEISMLRCLVLLLYLEMIWYSSSLIGTTCYQPAFIICLDY